MKNNELDGVLFSIAEFERLSDYVEYSEFLEKSNVAKILEAIPKQGGGGIYSMGLIRNDVDQIVAVDI